jgi:hypothetical protein
MPAAKKAALSVCWHVWTAKGLILDKKFMFKVYWALIESAEILKVKGEKALEIKVYGLLKYQSFPAGWDIPEKDHQCPNRWY